MSPFDQYYVITELPLDGLLHGLNGRIIDKISLADALSKGNCLRTPFNLSLARATALSGAAAADTNPTTSTGPASAVLLSWPL